MKRTVLKEKQWPALALMLKLISILFDMQILFYFPDYSTAPSWFESKVMILFKLMKTTE